ncbi:MAG: glucosamine-6-phosphate isomerase, partial [Atopobiaceae bacterium]|nr:glucosamine-6-phosphate isomerase [Atopobiaceae bacterium]
MLQNRLTTAEIMEWCSIPWRELKDRELKAKLDVYPEKRDMFVTIGNMMADEVIAHNEAGLPT